MSTVERLHDDIPETVRRLKRLAAVSDAQIGRAIGLSRNVANNRMIGNSRWDIEELRRYMGGPRLAEGT